MKKTITILCLVATMFLIGCDTEPTEWDHQSTGWKLWASGVVDKTRIDIDGSIRTFIIEFEEDLKVKETHFHNFNDVEEKTYGSVYRYNGGVYYYHIWVPKVSPSSAKPVANLKYGPSPTVDILCGDTPASVVETKVVKHGWTNLMTPPPAYQTVLVKFENGICTTAYYTPTGDWKSEMDRKKLSGGIALKAVKQWKLVDLE